MQFTGHPKCQQPQYKSCLQQQRKMLETLSPMYSGAGRAEEAKQPSADIRTALGGVFSGAHLDGCFNMYMHW